MHLANARATGISRNPRSCRANDAGDRFQSNEAAAEVSKRLEQSGLQFEPTSKDYFLFTVQQVAFIRLCGGDPRTMQGGDPELGQRIVNNGQHIIDHYWRSGKD
ncbi:hypothetical protein [Agrobacterium tumefaciens]|uniref:hypothetical protein n=1 Tax=Agrobacterium tumefaciens TaxID=358 RepID=UPI001F1596BB|nr:hypothetical protein [Agrobacterium tumefaciens]